MTAFQHIGIIGKHHSYDIASTVHAVIHYIQQQQLQVCVDALTAETLSDVPCTIASIEEMGMQCDLVIVIGGDGSLLGAARALSPYDVKLVGINRGSLGFLTDIMPDKLQQQLGPVLNGQYREEERFLLHGDVKIDDDTVAHGNALNDIVLLPGDIAHMIEFEIYIDQQFVSSQRADGLIVTTPTGSTAYALSAGGPILHPTLDALTLVPMFPHKLSSRPIVVPGSSCIDLCITAHASQHPRVSYDGQHTIELEPGASVHIKKAMNPLQLIHPDNHDFYATLRTKLGWEQRH